MRAARRGEAGGNTEQAAKRAGGDPRERKFHPWRNSSLKQRSQDRSRGRGRRRGRGGRRAYVERCPGSCILTKLRRQSARVHSGNFSRFDGVVSRDDDSSCKGSCGSHGFCRDGRCVCVALYEGERCERPVSLPKGLHPDFGDRDFVINSNTLRSMVGKVITYKTNPKAGDGLTHTLKLMVSDQMVGLRPSGTSWETSSSSRAPSSRSQVAALGEERRLTRTPQSSVSTRPQRRALRRTWAARRR